MSNRHKWFTDSVSWFGKPSSTVSESQDFQLPSRPGALISAGGHRQLVWMECPAWSSFTWAWALGAPPGSPSAPWGELVQNSIILGL